MALIFRSEVARAAAGREAFHRQMPGLDLRMWDEPGGVADIEFALVWKPPRGVLRSFPNLKAIFSIGAGVDHLFTDPDLPEGVPVVRMVEPELTRGMTEYVVLHALRHHRRQREMEANQRAAKWELISVPTTPSRKVGIMGLGELGQAAARALVALEFDVAGWSRMPKDIPGVESFHLPVAANGGDRGYPEQRAIRQAARRRQPYKRGARRPSGRGRYPGGAGFGAVVRGDAGRVPRGAAARRPSLLAPFASDHHPA
jgi:hypothetical protein